MTVAEPATAQVILDAARTRLLADGYARLSTRKVAHEAGVPLSQVHYHFGSKGGMVLALLEVENQRRLVRQAAMYAEDIPLWRRYEQACDFLEDDLESGYVRVLQEMIAAGWSTPEIGAATREMVTGWYELLNEVATEAAARFGGLGPFSPSEAAALIVNAFIGAEALLLLGFDRHQIPIRASLRRVGELIRAAEERPVAIARSSTGRGDAGGRAGDRRLRRAGRGQAPLGASSATASRRSLLLPTWSIAHSRHWKFQVPYLARHYRVITFDGRGWGLSDRPTEPSAYSYLEFAADTLAVLDATETDRAVLAGLSLGCRVGPAARG